MLLVQQNHRSNAAKREMSCCRSEKMSIPTEAEGIKSLALD